jgi:hypothetical protein
MEYGKRMPCLMEYFGWVGGLKFNYRFGKTLEIHAERAIFKKSSAIFYADLNLYCGITKLIKNFNNGVFMSGS